MRIKKVELKQFKRFTNLIVDEIPSTAKLIVLVGPNGSGKSSFMEAFNHYYKYSGYNDIGDYLYLNKSGNSLRLDYNEWFNMAVKKVNIDFHDATFSNGVGQNEIKGHFYFRSAYRNEPQFQIDSMYRQPDPIESIRLPNLIQNDQTVSSNYQRLVANTIAGLYDNSNDEKTVAALREELVGKIRQSIENVFEDLKFSSLGDPLNNGSFYFSKGIITDFDYRNLSAGEKSAFDLILDMVVQSQYYPDAIYCIDEPEIHMHTKLQGKVLRELYGLIPESSQLWVSTHSIGMLKEAEDIEKENPGTVIFLDFDNRDFDVEQVLHPAQINKAVLNKFYELAFGDFSQLILPRTIVFCEGDPNGGVRKDYDKTIYTMIFGNARPDTYFISGGSCNEIENIESKFGEVMTKLLEGTKIIKMVDLDDRSDMEIEELNQKKIKVLSRRHIESYLLDDEIIEKLCITINCTEKVEECLQAKQDAIDNAVSRGKPVDDLKSASGEIYVSLKRILGLRQCGNNKDTFMRDTLAPLVTSETEVYKQLEQDIFGD